MNARGHVVEQLELKVNILEMYALHLERLRWSISDHNEISCDTCTRASAVLRPNEPWKGWAI